MQDFIFFIVHLVGNLGYLGLFLMMFLESSFVPFPSEVAMIPAGYLAYSGEMDIILVIISGTAGSLAGALVNYFIALYVGREFLLKYGKYFGVTDKTMHDIETFFCKYGHISTFIGRLIPVLRQYISLPAGIARMNLAQFCFYTSLGAGIWVSILTLFGYYIGSVTESSLSVDDIISIFSTHKQLTLEEKELKNSMYYLLFISAILVFGSMGMYIFYKKNK